MALPPTLDMERIPSTMTIYSIYRITNLVNGKCYVGFGKNPKQRWHCHVSMSKDEADYFPTFQKSAPGLACSSMNSHALESYVGADGNGGKIFAGLLNGRDDFQCDALPIS